MNVAPVASLRLEIERITNVSWSKGNDLATPNGEVPYQLLSELLLLPKFNNSSPSVTGDRDLSCDYELMSLLPPEEEYPMEPFQ